ncbi:hypothetical protein JK203_15790 [Gluconobacter cerinus]|uniref:hypothetical protein n=1 Tax=Gluconobacter cerinus TaxID=38307 RepID=UPI001B8B07C9|nr:hypothetical protein [Gluconobacter cerinus]MBS1048916.1 hypothetical protein [Gluconobacter cerinus]
MPKTRELRRPDTDGWRALCESGFFRQFVPKEFNGYAQGLDGFIDNALLVASICPSTGWVAALLAGHNWFAANLSADVQAELFGASSFILASSLSTPPGVARQACGGLLIDGRWKWASGVGVADWIIAAAILSDGTIGPELKIVLFPATQARVVDTWHAHGLAGSGSHDVEVDALFVPYTHVLSDMNILNGTGPAASLYAEPVWRVPAMTLGYLLLAIPALGAARGLLASFVERLKGRIKQGSVSLQAESEMTRIRVARAELLLEAAECTLRTVGKEMEMDPGSGGHPVDRRLAWRARIANAVGFCRNATATLVEVSGSSAMRAGQDFERFLADFEIMASHAAFDTDQAFEAYGRSLLGGPPPSSFA